MARAAPTIETMLRERARHWPESVTPESGAIVRVFRFGKLVLANSAEQVAAHGLSFTEFEVLASLRGAAAPHVLAPSALYDAVLISSGGLTKVLRGLEARGLVSRAADAADGRVKPVRLTRKGRALIERAMADVLESDRTRMLAGLTAREIAAFIRLLRKLLKSLETDFEAR